MELSLVHLVQVEVVELLDWMAQTELREHQEQAVWMEHTLVLRELRELQAHQELQQQVERVEHRVHPDFYY